MTSLHLDSEKPRSVGRSPVTTRRINSSFLISVPASFMSHLAFACMRQSSESLSSYRRKNARTCRAKRGNAACAAGGGLAGADLRHAGGDIMCSVSCHASIRVRGSQRQSGQQPFTVMTFVSWRQNHDSRRASACAFRPLSDTAIRLVFVDFFDTPLAKGILGIRSIK